MGVGVSKHGKQLEPGQRWYLNEGDGCFGCDQVNKTNCGERFGPGWKYCGSSQCTEGKQGTGCEAICCEPTPQEQATIAATRERLITNWVKSDPCQAFSTGHGYDLKPYTFSTSMIGNETAGDLCQQIEACNKDPKCKGVLDRFDMASTVSLVNTLDGQVANANTNFYVKRVLDPKIKAGGGGGGASSFVQCNDNELLTGMKIRAGDTIDGIASLYCNTTDGIYRGTAAREIPVNWGGGGGSVDNYVCPKNQALNGYTIRAGNWTDSLILQCGALDGKTAGTTFPRSGGGGGGEPQPRECPQNAFLIGTQARSGSRLDSLQGTCIDGSDIVNTQRTIGKQLDCCAGITKDGLACGPWIPGSNACQEAKRNYCSTKDYFFTDACKQMFAPNDRQIQSQSDNETAQRVCASIKGSTDATPQQLDWCSCVNADVPADTPMVAKGIFQCINPQCMGKGLKTFGLTCPSAITICSQDEFRSSLEKSKVGKLYVQNNCGNISPPATNGGGEPAPVPTPTPGSTSGVSRTAVAVVGGMGILVALLLLFALIKTMRK